MYMCFSMLSMCVQMPIICTHPNFQPAGYYCFVLYSLFLVPVDRGHEVDIFISETDKSLLLTTSQDIVVNNWPTNFHPIMSANLSIFLHQMDVVTGEWNLTVSDAVTIAGDDTVNVNSPPYHGKIPSQNINDVVPVIFEMTAKFGNSLTGIFTAKKWSGVYFLKDSSANLSQLCSDWVNTDTLNIDENLISRCPNMKAIIELPNSGFGKDSKSSMLRRVGTTEGYEQMYWNYFHPGSESCYRSITINRYRLELVYLQ